MGKDRYESELKRAVSGVILSELNDSRLDWVTVNKVRLSPDYHSAVIFVSVIGDAGASIEVLNNASGYIRHLLSRRLKWRRVPRLSFSLYKEELVGE